MRVSLALATHDGGTFLEELLATIAAQTRPPAELVAYDDASSDNSVDTLERFSSTASFPVRIIRGRSPVGSTRAFERALEACTADLIALCDQDDLWRNDKIEKAVTAFERTPELALFFSDATVIEDSGRPLEQSLWTTLASGPPARGRDLGFFVNHLVRPTVPGCTVMLRARCLDVVLPFPPTLGDSERAMQHDAWLVAIAAATGAVEALSDALITYRVHGDQQIGLRGAAARTGLGSTTRRAVLLMAGRFRLKSDLGHRSSRIQLVSERLARVEENPWTSECRAAAIDIAEHLEQRIALPRRRRQRVRGVLREWRTHRYRRYSSGAISAIADVFSR